MVDFVRRAHWRRDGRVAGSARRDGGDGGDGRLFSSAAGESGARVEARQGQSDGHTGTKRPTAVTRCSRPRFESSGMRVGSACAVRREWPRPSWPRELRPKLCTSSSSAGPSAAATAFMVALLRPTRLTRVPTCPRENPRWAPRWTGMDDACVSMREDMTKIASWNDPPPKSTLQLTNLWRACLLRPLLL